jgi:hypothetical protein
MAQQKQTADGAAVGEVPRITIPFSGQWWLPYQCGYRTKASGPGKGKTVLIFEWVQCDPPQLSPADRLASLLFGVFNMATATPTTLQTIEKTIAVIASDVILTAGPALQPILQGLLSKPIAAPTADQTAKIVKLSTDLAAILPDLAAYYQSITATA